MKIKNGSLFWRRARAVVGTLPIIALAACGGPSPEEVTNRAATHLMQVIEGLDRAVNAAENQAALRSLRDLLSWMRLDQRKLLDRLPAPGLPGAGSSQSGSEGQGSRTPAAPGSTHGPTPRDLAQTEQALRKFLAERIFTQANVVSAGNGTTVFSIKGSILCELGLFGSSSGSAPMPYPRDAASGHGTSGDSPETPAPKSLPSPQPSPENTVSCTKELDLVELRVDATLTENGIVLSLRIGQTEHAAIIIALGEGRLAATIDLGGVAESARWLASAMGKAQDLDSMKLAGRVFVSLVTAAPADATLMLSIMEPIAVEYGTGNRRFALAVGHAAEVASAKLSAGQLGLEINWGPTSLAWPATWVFDRSSTKELPESLAAVFSGFIAQLTFDGQGKVVFNQLAVPRGENKVSLGTSDLLRIEANAIGSDALRGTIDLSSDRPTCSLTPDLELRLDLNFAAIDPYLEAKSPPWAAKESYRLQIKGRDGEAQFMLLDTAPHSGTSRAPVVEDQPTTPDPAPEPTALLRMVRGTLLLKSLIEPRSMEVVEGQCLWGDHDSADSNLLDFVSAGPCDQ
jgi:hypothetical protein